MILFISVSSKNKNLLKAFIILIQNIIISNRIYFSDYSINQIQNKKKLKYYSVLMSPHVFKTAQRKIGFKNTSFLWRFRVNIRFINQIIIITKKILQINLKDLNVNLKFFVNTIDNKNRSRKTFDPDYCYLDSFSFNINYIRLLDMYGSYSFHTYKLLNEV